MCTRRLWKQLYTDQFLFGTQREMELIPVSSPSGPFWHNCWCLKRTRVNIRTHPLLVSLLDQTWATQTHGAAGTGRQAQSLESTGLRPSRANVTIRCQFDSLNQWIAQSPNFWFPSHQLTWKCTKAPFQEESILSTGVCALPC